MEAEGDDSVTRWLAGVKVGDPVAVERVWHRYFGSLVRLARAHLRSAPRGAEDEEDAALSAFDSFCDAAARGRFPRLEDRDDLWRVLVTITARKAMDQAKRQRAERRGGGRVVGEAALDGAVPGGDFFAEVADSGPTPEFAAIMAEECRRRLDALPDDVYRRVALLKMEGFTNEEIAERVGFGLRSVVRKLGLIRKAWLGGTAS
jgi:DNA-directed RNA polymerase specialized sigma24 family protein